MSLNFISGRAPSLFFLLKNKEVRRSGNGRECPPFFLGHLRRFLKTYFMSLRIKLFVLFLVFKNLVPTTAWFPVYFSSFF